MSEDLLPLSVFIIAKNEADRLPYTLRSVIPWADEVIVIDSGSDDGTQDIARQMGATIVYHEWQGYGPQKVYGESLCRHDWVLNLDADEALSPPLREEISQLFNDDSIHLAAGYRFDIKIVNRFQKIPGRFAPSNDPVRLYHRALAGFKDSSVHDSVIDKQQGNNKKPFGRKLSGYVIHRCFRSLTHAVEKINRYSSMQAEDMYKRGRYPCGMRVVIEPVAAFSKAYFLRRYCFLGVDGFIESIIYAFARTLRLSKARELTKSPH